MITTDYVIIKSELVEIMPFIKTHISSAVHKKSGKLSKVMPYKIIHDLIDPYKLRDLVMWPSVLVHFHKWRIEGEGSWFNWSNNYGSIGVIRIIIPVSRGLIIVFKRKSTF